ncbi:unnamed protein product [Fusarium graminearum]|uniref:C2H2-type domain-containing protein n=1 Tax=Gibberella zeae TaxID=5518 RepID=A0A9N8RKG1_GIBZA|nr:unnamed protein product [Fusarium graminearum]CAG1999145.1 unnamed protein product [Fusarium graminearum]
MELFSHVIIERDFPDESISNTSQMLSPINLKTIIRVLLHQPNLQAVLIQVFITKIIPRFGRKTPQATLPPPLPALRPSVRVQRVVMVSTRDQRIYKRDWWWTVAVRKGILLNFETNMQTRSWKEGTHYNKHYNRVHNLRYKCESCAFAGADKKELHRHYWVFHRDWAEANNIPDISGKCKGCGRTFRRKDRIRLHLRRYPSCREKLGLSEQES